MLFKQSRSNPTSFRTLLALLAASLPGLMACGSPTDAETVVMDTVVQDDLMTAGRSVSIEARVEGDVAAAGSDVTVSAPIEGYVMGAGRNVTVEAPVGNDLWAAGENVTLSSAVGNNAMLAGQTVHLEPGASVGDDAKLAGRDVRSEARIANDLSIGASTAEIGGEIGGVVRARAEHVTLLPGAILHGDLIVRSPEPPIISPGAHVMGRVEHRMADARSWSRSWPVLWLGLFLALLLLDFAALTVAPTWSARVAETLRTQTVSAILNGMLVLIAVPVLAALLLITIVGIPVAVVLTAAWVAALVLSAAFVSYRIGLWVFERAHRSTASRWSAMALGALVVSFGVSLPIVGWLVALIVILCGAGAMAVERRARRMERHPA